MSKDFALAPSPKALCIAVIGIGGIGSTFAFQLARIGHHDVTAIARPGSARLEQLKRDNGIINMTGERAELCVADRLDEEAPYDLVLVTLPAHQVEAVLPALRCSAARWIQFMFNTFDPETLPLSCAALFVTAPAWATWSADRVPVPLRYRQTSSALLGSRP